MTLLSIWLTITVGIGVITLVFAAKALVQQVQEERTPEGRKKLAANWRAEAQELIERAERLEHD